MTETAPERVNGHVKPRVSLLKFAPETTAPAAVEPVKEPAAPRRRVRIDSLRRVIVETRTNPTYRFAVRATDKAGNIGSFATGSSFRVTVLSEASGSISYSKGWGAITSPSYDGKRAMSTRTPKAFATYTFVGTDFAWISTKSPIRGQARVYVDGVYAGIVNTFSSSTQVRQIVFSRSWSSLARHTIRIEVVRRAAYLEGFVTRG